MPGGGSTYRRGGRKKGTPNKPKGQQLVVALENAEREVRKIVLAGNKITSLGKDRLAELDEWAYGIAQTFAPEKDDKGKARWECEGDEARFMRLINFSGRCAAARAAFESRNTLPLPWRTRGRRCRTSTSAIRSR